MRPSLYCQNCFEIQEKSSKRPACKTAHGCEIEDVADDISLNRLVESFLRFKVISEQAGYSRPAEKYLEREGLADEPELLIELEAVYSKAISARRSQSEETERVKQIGKRGRR